MVPVTLTSSPVYSGRDTLSPINPAVCTTVSTL